MLSFDDAPQEVALQMTEVELECAAGVDNLPQKLEEDVVHGPNWNDRKYKYQKKTEWSEEIRK